LRDDRRIESVQPLQTFHVLARDTAGSATPDPYGPLQRNLVELHLAQAQRTAMGRGVSIALIDTGLDAAHPDLAGRLASAHDFTDHPAASPERHATALAGVIAADADNGIGMRGVAPLARLLPLRACWAQHAGGLAAACDSLSLARALDYAIAAHVQIINLSLAGPYDGLLARLIDAALAHNIVVVAATDKPGDFPASAPGVIAVEASEHAAANAIAAPGRDILGTAPGAAYDWFNGASFAAAQISGIVALLREHAPDMNPAQVALRLRSALRPAGRAALDSPHWINACAALNSDASAGCG
jgi:subtilisin family serine protease